MQFSWDFFFNDTATTEIYTLSLHDALPISVGRCIFNDILPKAMPFYNYALTAKGASRVIADTYAELGRPATIKLLDDMKRSESTRLNSSHANISYAVFCLKKKKYEQYTYKA